MLRNGLEPWHILIVVAVVVLMFGSRKLPDMARGLGKSMRILKAETTAMRQEAAPAARPDDAPADGAHPGGSDRPARPAVEAPEQPARTGEPSTRTTYP